ncbi:MAG: phosphatidate cytidylyltransferase [Candidatus Nomurabacteria bacterium]|nr:phosphatidate cytidylyltransferase [Candidatus Nomurabacteria bacterium]
MKGVIDVVTIVKDAAAKVAHTVVTSVVILCVPVVCAWAFYRDQLLGQVLSEIILVCLCYLSVRELNAMQKSNPFAARRSYALKYWRIMTVVWCLVLSALVWILPDKGVWIVQSVTLTMMLADACALGVGTLARRVFECRTLGEIWPKFKQWSPNKTIAGSLACVLAAWMGFAVLMALAVQAEWLMLGSTPMVLACVALAFFPIFGVLGDFFESRIKRQFGVKDSAEVLDPKHIVPWGRHGGASDRIDSHVGGIAGFITLTLAALGVVLIIAATLLCLVVYVALCSVALSYSYGHKVHK